MTLQFQRTPTLVPFLLVVFSDSDYASCPNTRRAVSGYACMLTACPTCWLAEKQKSVASSTTEEEYMALATTSRQAVWYLNVFTQLGSSIHIKIMADNT